MKTASKCSSARLTFDNKNNTSETSQKARKKKADIREQIQLTRKWDDRENTENV